MGTRHSVRSRDRSAPARTRERVVAAVRDLLREGSFHEATVEQVASRAGVSRATLYQHFGSRLGLVDAICETFDANPALVAIREAVRDPDPGSGLERSIAHTVGFWASEEAVLEPLYGAAAIDPAARDLVARQRADRRGEYAGLLGRMEEAGLLRPELAAADALGILLVLTSFETYQELRRLAGLEERQVTATLQASARTLLAA
jgi:AcrR family transcriptional regulator